MKGPYDDIIRLRRPVSKKYPRMSISNRAAQFAPFAALAGFDHSIAETARLTDCRIELDDDRKAALNEKLQLLLSRAEEQPQISIIYFIPDEQKNGGAYVTVTGILRRIAEYERLVILEDGTRIPVEEIIEIDGVLP